MDASTSGVSSSKERLKGFEADLNHLIDDFVLQVVDGAPFTYSTFKKLWKERHMSFVIATPLSIQNTQSHMQSIFMAALDRLDHPSPLSNREEVPNGLKKQPVRMDSSDLGLLPDPMDVLPTISDDEAIDDWLKSNKPTDLSLDEYLLECGVDDKISPVAGDNSHAPAGGADNNVEEDRWEPMVVSQGLQESEVEDIRRRWQQAFPKPDGEGVLTYLEALGEIVVPIEEETETSISAPQPTAMLQVVNASEQIEDILGYDDDHVTRPPDLEADVELADVPRYLGVPHFERNLCLWVPFEAKVAALYAVYTCYKLQIFERKAYIHLPYPILCELVSILPELQFQGIWDACEMLRALLKENAFVFGSYRRVPSLEGVSLEAKASEAEVGRELAFHLRTTMRGACNHSGIQLHCKRYSKSRSLLTELGKWTAGLIGEQNSVEAIFDCSMGDRIANTVKEQYSLIQECVADDDLRYVRRPASTIVEKHKKGLDSLCKSGPLMTSNNEVATGQDVQRLRRRWRQKLLSQNDKVKLKGAAKRKGGNTNIVTKRIIRRLRKDMTENEREEMEMLKGIPRAAQQVVLRSLERQRASVRAESADNQ